MVRENTPAPDFSLPDKEGNLVTLSGFRGKKVILYFYPKDNTSGCTKQACAFAASNEHFAQLNAVVVGVSKDSMASHLRFVQKYNLPFVLLSDTDHKVTEAYGAWGEKTRCGKTTFGTIRSTFVIDENGTIIRAMRNVKADSNADDVLHFLEGLGSGGQA